MNAARARLLLAAALLFGNSACATILRSSRADITFVNAPDNLKAFDEDGSPLPLQREEDGKMSGQLGYKTRALTLASGESSTKVELDTRVSLGYVIADFLLYVFPMIVDWGTSKWTNFADVDARQALSKGGPAPAVDPWAPKATAKVETAKGRADRPLIQAAPSPQGPPPPPQQALIEPASNRQSQPAAHRTPIVVSGKLAVLDFRSYTDALKAEDVRYFTDVVRGATLKASPALQVMTRENLLVLLQATGKDAANCEGECEVDTGRRIGADAVVSGEILKVGSHFKLSLKLHETQGGRLLSTAIGSGKTIDELDESAQAAAVDLISPAR